MSAEMSRCAFRHVAAIVATMAVVGMVETASGDAKTLIWNGEDGARWEDANWLDGETPSTWIEGANAVFPASAAVLLGREVSVSNLTAGGALSITGATAATYEGWLSPNPVLVFPGLTLDDLDCRPLSADVYGTYSSGDWYAKAYHYVRTGSTAVAQFQKVHNGHLRCIKVVFTELSDGIHAKTEDTQSWLVDKGYNYSEKLGVDFGRLSPPVFGKTYLQTSSDGRGVGICNLRYHAARVSIAGTAKFGGELTLDRVSAEVVAPVSQEWTQPVISQEGWLSVKGCSSETTDRTFGIEDPEVGGAEAAWLTDKAADNVFTNMVLARTVPVSAVMRGSYIGFNAKNTKPYNVKFYGQTMTCQYQFHSGGVKCTIVEFRQEGADVTACAKEAYFFDQDDGGTPDKVGMDFEAEIKRPGNKLTKYSIKQYGIKSIVLRTVTVPSLILSATGDYKCYNMCVDNAQIVYDGAKSQPTYLLARNKASVIYKEGTYNSGGGLTRRYESGSTLLAPNNLKVEARAICSFDASELHIPAKNYFNELTLLNGTRVFGGGNLQSGYYNASPTSTYISAGLSANFIDTPMVLLRHNQTGAQTNTLILDTATDLMVSGDIRDELNNDLKGAVVVKRGSATLALSGANTFAGRFTVEEGTVALGGDDALPASAPLTLAGGVVMCGASVNATGALTLSGNATVNLENGSLAFADSSGETWVEGMRLDFTGPDPHPGRSIRFGTSKSGLTSGQLNAVRYNGKRVSIDENGYLRGPRGLVISCR